jgi:hypothetical protein
VGDAPVMNSRMPWRLALAATRPIALAAVDHECLALVGDAVEHAADRRRCAKKNAPVMR